MRVKWESLYGAGNSPAAHPHLLVFLTYRGHTMKGFTTPWMPFKQHCCDVGYCIDPRLGKEDEFSSEHFQKAWAVCAHIQAMPQWSTRGANLQCYRLCLVCSRGVAWHQRMEILSYRSFLCSSHKTATFWSKRAYLKGVCCVEGKPKLIGWAVSFLPKPNRSNCLWGEQRERDWQISPDSSSHLAKPG